MQDKMYSIDRYLKEMDMYLKSIDKSLGSISRSLSVLAENKKNEQKEIKTDLFE